MLSLADLWGIIRRKFEVFNRASMRVFSTVIFSVVYILILPWFAVFAKRSRKSRTTWYPWTLKSDTIEDIKKQY
jgi:hypothetical protein